MIEKDAPLLPSSSDIPLENSLILSALEIYEALTHFWKTLRLSPFTFELFCIALRSDASSRLLADCHKALLRCLLRENDKNNTTLSEHKDCKDSLAIFFSCMDDITFFELTHMYLHATRKHLSQETSYKLRRIFAKQHYLELSAEERLTLLKVLVDAFIATDLVRESLDKTDEQVHEDHCRQCHKRGDLLCCESCTAVSHLTCVIPPLASFPEGDWFCVACSMLRESAKKQNNNIKSNNKSRTSLGTDSSLRTYWFIACRIFVEKSGVLVAYYSTEDQLELLINHLQQQQQQHHSNPQQQYNNNSEILKSINEHKDAIVCDMRLLAERQACMYAYRGGGGGGGEGGGGGDRWMDVYMKEVYSNVYATETLALTKQQQTEEKEKRRHLSYKFSLLGFWHFCWLSDNSDNTFQNRLSEVALDPDDDRGGGGGGVVGSGGGGSIGDTVEILRATLIHFKDCIPAAFFHANWTQHSGRWARAVRLCGRPREFSLALLILQSSLKPFVLHEAWHKAAGHLELEVRSAEERESERRREVEVRALLKEEVNNCLHVCIKNPLRFKHQLWKQRGEEFRMTGRHAWMWIGPTRRSQMRSSKFKHSFIYASASKGRDVGGVKVAAAVAREDGVVDGGGGEDGVVDEGGGGRGGCLDRGGGGRGGWLDGLLERAVLLHAELQKKKREVDVAMVLMYCLYAVGDDDDAHGGHGNDRGSSGHGNDGCGDDGVKESSGKADVTNAGVVIGEVANARGGPSGKGKVVKVRLDQVYSDFTVFLSSLERFRRSDKNPALRKTLEAKMKAAQESLHLLNSLHPSHSSYNVNLGRFPSKTPSELPSGKQGGLPKSHKFQVGRGSTGVYVLDAVRKRKAARRGGRAEVPGYVYQQHNFCAYKHLLQTWRSGSEAFRRVSDRAITGGWNADLAGCDSLNGDPNRNKMASFGPHHHGTLSLSCAPRPTLANAWTFKLNKCHSLSSFGLHLRVMWASVRWEELNEAYPPMGLLHLDDHVDNTTTTHKLIKRRILTPKFDPINYKVEYLVQKTTRANQFEVLPSGFHEKGAYRRGLRERRVVEAVVCREWVPEEQLQLWQIKYFNSVWEKQNAKKPPDNDKSSSTATFHSNSNGHQPSHNDHPKHSKISNSNASEVVNGSTTTYGEVVDPLTTAAATTESQSSVLKRPSAPSLSLPPSSSSSVHPPSPVVSLSSPVSSSLSPVSSSSPIPSPPVSPSSSSSSSKLSPFPSSSSIAKDSKFDSIVGKHSKVVTYYRKRRRGGLAEAGVSASERQVEWLSAVKDEEDVNRLQDVLKVDHYNDSNDNINILVNKNNKNNNNTNNNNGKEITIKNNNNSVNTRTSGPLGVTCQREKSILIRKERQERTLELRLRGPPSGAADAEICLNSLLITSYKKGVSGERYREVVCRVGELWKVVVDVKCLCHLLSAFLPPSAVHFSFTSLPSKHLVALFSSAAGDLEAANVAKLSLGRFTCDEGISSTPSGNAALMEYRSRRKRKRSLKRKDAVSAETKDHKYLFISSSSSSIPVKCLKLSCDQGMSASHRTTTAGLHQELSTGIEVKLHGDSASVDGDVGHFKGNSAQTEVNPGQTEVNPGQTEVNPGQTEVNPGQTEVNPGQTEVNLGQAKVNPGQTEINSGQTEINSGQTEVKSGQVKRRSRWSREEEACKVLHCLRKIFKHKKANQSSTIKKSGNGNDAEDASSDDNNDVDDDDDDSDMEMGDSLVIDEACTNGVDETSLPVHSFETSNSNGHLDSDGDDNGKSNGDNEDHEMIGLLNEAEKVDWILDGETGEKMCAGGGGGGGGGERLHCICNTLYDESQFYVGCNACGRWLHGACVNLTPQEASLIDSYLCDRCLSGQGGKCGAVGWRGSVAELPVNGNNGDMVDEGGFDGDEFLENRDGKEGGGDNDDAEYDVCGGGEDDDAGEVMSNDEEERRKTEEKEEEDEGMQAELHCVCATPYDESRFYIGCDECLGWFHGDCVGVSADDALNLTSFTCPVCR